MHRTMGGLAVALTLLTLAGCGADKGAEAPGGAEVSDRTLAQILDKDRAFSALGRVTENAGLTAVLDGRGPYTVFAPANGAFEKAGADFGDAAMKAQAAALLRAHIVPGALTRQDIQTAIAADADGRVEMRTMADDLLTFSRDGDVLIVTAADGARATLMGREGLASNGVIQPVDGLLAAPAAAAAN